MPLTGASRQRAHQTGRVRSHVCCLDRTVISKGFRTTEVEWASVTLVTVPPHVESSDLAVLNDEERARAGRFVFVADRAKYVTGRAALRRALGVEIGLAAAAVPLSVDARGRPTLGEGFDARVDFNISHSGPVVVLGIARGGGRIGVDVEWHGRARDLRALVLDVMGPRESEFLSTCDEAAFVRAFLGCWTRKEAILKGIGVGIEFPLTTIDVPHVPAHQPHRVEVASNSVWTVFTADPAVDLTVSVALAGEVFPSCRTHSASAVVAQVHS